MHYKSGEDFEHRVLGPCLGGYEGYRSFSECALFLLRQNEAAHPATRVGEILFHSVKSKLDKAKVDTSGLVLVNSVGGGIDYHHQTDAFFFLPSVASVVTIDLFNADSDFCEFLRDCWDFESCCSYGESEFQSHLYSYKKNRGGDGSPWTNMVFGGLGEDPLHPRPENHLILTPYHTEFRENRERFCRLVAEYFTKASYGGLTKT